MEPRPTPDPIHPESAPGIAPVGAPVGASVAGPHGPRPTAPRVRARLGLRQAMIAAFVAGLVVPALALWWWDEHTAARQLDPVVSQRQSQLMAVSALALADPWRRRDSADLAAVQAALLRDPLVCGVALVDAPNAPAGPAPAVRPPPTLGHCELEEGVVWRDQPVMVAGSPIGVLRLGFDQRVRARLLHERRAALGRLALVLVVLGSVVPAWVLHRRVLVPLRRLKRQASALARTGLPPPADAPRPRQDDLGQLAHHLDQAHARVTQLMGELEGRHAEMRRTAMVDPLTALPNRRLFKELFDRALPLAQREQRAMAVMFIDLDRFKQVNDTLGHAAGDLLLRTIADRLRGVVRASDTVGRLGGDEFVALLPDVRGPEGVAQTALRVIHAVETPVPLSEGVSMQVSASVGVARYPDDGLAFDALLARADEAMYRAKAEGRGRFVLASAPRDDSPGSPALPGQGPPADARDLQRALAAHEFLLMYQPVIDTRDGRAVAAEALLRWAHPGLGPLAPARFLPRVEALRQMGPLGHRVRSLALAQAVDWRASGALDGPVAVNLSAVEFRDPDLPQSLRRLLAERDTRETLLVLEVSCHTAMDDPEFSQARAEELAALGVPLVLDDVGSSLVSLARLGQLRPARLKVDAALVARLPGDPQAWSTAHAVVQLARSLGVGVSACGVETEAQRDTLSHLGCHWQQGFLFARPAMGSDWPEWATPLSRQAHDPRAPGPRMPDPRQAWPWLASSQASSRSKPH